MIPELFTRMGLESIFVARIDDGDRNYRSQRQELEFIWQPTYFGSTGPVESETGIFTQVMNNNYQAPCKLNVFQMDLKEEI